MQLDVLVADFVRLTRNRVDAGAPRRVDAQGRKLDLMVKLLQRDDPLRRSYLQRRWWHGHRSLVPLSGERCTPLSRIAPSCRR